MEQEPPQGNILPFAIGGSFLLVCCLGPAFLASGGVGLFAWIGGIDGMLSIALTMAAFATIVVFKREDHVRRCPLYPEDQYTGKTL